MAVRLIAIILIALLFPLTVSVPSVAACSTATCCGETCSDSIPADQFSCCGAPATSDWAINQACETPQLASVGYEPVATWLVAISPSRNVVHTREHSSPDRLASLAFLCSRQI